MKEFSKSWIGSKKPGKQRKYRANAPLHIKKRYLSSHLSKELRQKHNMKSISVRKGDTVKIMRGQFRGKTGKIERVDTKKTEIYVQGIEMKRKDGTKSFYPINPSNLMITEIDTGDKRRLK
ncbi:50S ribosomal protein L24 [Candidatus Woesearchaeota archaeon]|nr:50S ribosomal protein L24 [Candidatus Woesearchaeota archaeon]